MIDKINLMLPTYKRHIGLRRFVNSALKHADDPSCLRFSFCVNADDQGTADVIERELFFPVNGGYEIITEDTKQPNLALYFNMMYASPKFRNHDTLVTMVGDDMEFMTDGWDRDVLNAVNERDGKAIVYCNDNFIAGETMSVNLFVSQGIVEATGLPFMCDLFHADMIDVVWYYVGKYTSTLTYLRDTVIQHNHGSKAIAWQDETFRRLQPLREFYGKDKTHLQQALQVATHAAANMIGAGIGKWNILGH